MAWNPFVEKDKPISRRIKELAAAPLPVLILGESGTGKELVATDLHVQSGRAGRLIVVDCASLAPHLIESELFGHEAGAFTGAHRSRDGLVHSAQHGTFFLDEIGELSLAAQARLLGLLERRTYRRVGDHRERRADIRVLAATWRDLDAMVAEGTFRRDLLHRLRVATIDLPALRDRREAIIPLMTHFLAQSGSSLQLSDSVRDTLEAWHWPGNVRELKNTAAYVAALCADSSMVAMADLPTYMHHKRQGPQISVRLDLPYLEARRVVLDAFQEQYVSTLLEQHDNNISAVARCAQMDRRSIQRILRRSRQTSAEPESSST